VPVKLLQTERTAWCFIVLAVLAATLSGCDGEPWNNPYRAADSERAILYSSFPERPKHLDPVSSYSENEALFTGQIYEPVVQYHFLSRPYRLVPLTATALPEPQYYAADGTALPADAPRESVDEAVYRISLRPGILYQPHPAFARDTDGGHVYHALSRADLAGRATLADFPASGTRELMAAD
jgi:oligopeptide transport system substrate-binding protein